MSMPEDIPFGGKGMLGQCPVLITSNPIRVENISGVHTLVSVVPSYCGFDTSIHLDFSNQPKVFHGKHYANLANIKPWL